MPKSQKHKRSRESDFKKPKLKLGKGKQVSNNSTNTSYSSKSIALPNQNIRSEKDVEEGSRVPTTRLNLTLNDLITRLSHYSPITRKEALIGLKEILVNNKILIGSNLGNIVHACSRLISDENPSVRKALKTFFSWFLRSADPRSLEPFCPIILFFSTSALAHIFLDIRVDAIHVIDILLEVVPRLVVSGWPRDNLSNPSSSETSDRKSSLNSEEFGLRLLKLYLSLVGCSSGSSGLTSDSATQLSSGSKLVIYKSLAQFINVATTESQDSSGKESIPSWVFRKEFKDERSFQTFLSLVPDPSSRSFDKSSPKILPSRIYHDDITNAHVFEEFTEAFIGDKPISISENFLSNPQTKEQSPQSSEKEDVPDTPLKLLRILNPTILSNFLDNAPSAFQAELNFQPTIIGSRPNNENSNRPSTISLELVWCVFSILRDLWRSIISTSNSLEVGPSDLRSLESILEKMSMYFVFGDDSLSQPSLSSKQMFQDLNLIYCDLVALLALSQKKVNVGNKLQVQLDRVGDYIGRTLEGEVGSISVNSSCLGIREYNAMMPIIWSLLKYGSKDGSKSIKHKNRTSDKNDCNVHGDGNGNEEGGDDHQKKKNRDRSEKVLEKFIAVVCSRSPNSQICNLGNEFLIRLCILDDLQGCEFAGEFDGFGSSTRETLIGWVLGLPKLLWTLNDKSPNTSMLLLTFLHRVVSKPMNFFIDSISGLPKLLVPFFSIKHRSSGKILRGPYERLNLKSQSLARGICWYLIDDDRNGGYGKDRFEGLVGREGIDDLKFAIGESGVAFI